MSEPKFEISFMKFCIAYWVIFDVAQFEYLAYDSEEIFVLSRFPMATREEIEDHNDNCAVCWERMESSRKLPCGHLFHKLVFS